MKPLSKAIAVTAVAAISVSCLSAYAAMPGKAGRMSLLSDSARIEARANTDENSRIAQRAAWSDEEAKAAMPKNRLNNKNTTGNVSGRMNAKDIEGKKFEKAELTEEEKATMLEKRQADLAAKLDAGEITQEEYDKIIAAIESGEFMFGGMGGRNKAPGMNKFNKAEKEAAES